MLHKCMEDLLSLLNVGIWVCRARISLGACVHIIHIYFFNVETLVCWVRVWWARGSCRSASTRASTQCWRTWPNRAWRAASSRSRGDSRQPWKRGSSPSTWSYFIVYGSISQPWSRPGSRFCYSIETWSMLNLWNWPYMQSVIVKEKTNNAC